MNITNLNINKGSSLFVKGPASIILKNGTLNAFDYIVPIKKNILIRPYRAIPFYAVEDSLVDVRIKSNEDISIFNEDLIPKDWREKADEIIKNSKSTIVFGGVDSGKTSFCCLLLNRCLKSKSKVFFMDIDPGQSNIGPPTMISVSKVNEPTIDVFRLNVFNAYPIGYTSPSYCIDSCISNISKLLKEVIDYGFDFLVIDSDGWVDGIDAIKYKLKILEVCSPDNTIVLENTSNSFKEELRKAGVNFLEISSPKNIFARNMDARKKIREFSYGKYLFGGCIRTIQSSWIKISFIDKSKEQLMEDYLSSLPKTIEQIEKPEIENKVNDIKKGLLSYLYDSTNKFIGIALTLDFDKKKKFLKIYTNVKSSIAKIIIGNMILDSEGKEIYQEMTKQ
ncbi:MAG: Clp1/GlmU family protein [Nitrososphaerota archaeon]